MELLNSGWGTSNLQGGSLPYFVNKNGQSNDNGFNTFSVSQDYISPWSNSFIWNIDEFQRLTFGINNQNTINGAHGKELSISMRLPKPHWLNKRAQNGTSLLVEWAEGQPLEDQALTDLQNAWDALPNQNVVKVFEWDQWESSVSRNEASGYKAAFDSLVSRRESIIGAFDIIIIAKANPNSIAYNLGDAGEGEAILNVQQQIVSERSNAFLLDSDDEQLAIDGIHYTSEAQINRGNDLVDIILSNT